MNDSDDRLDARAASLVESHARLLESLIAIRTKHQISQDVVASRMGVSQPTVAAFERYDANPTLASIRRYALAVGARINHDVQDDCVAHSAESFDAVIRPSGFSWEKRSLLPFDEWLMGSNRHSHA